MKSTPKCDVEIFSAALQLPSEERPAYLAQACGGNLELRARIKALLNAHAEAADFMEQSPAVALQQPGARLGEDVGDRIGRYKLLQKIGEGGCGVVFMAEQAEPVRRRVALKIIKPGMDSKSIIARFETERQALAMMDHPSIAKIFDGGATASGRPFFVMELIRGMKITDYCDQNSLSTNERLALFIQVCHAIQHAHQKGVIHRDIKPSNILVTANIEGAPLPVVIDFGIAKATANQPLTDKTLFTAFQMLVGTPAYMSPEQAAMSTLDVDTRTDIYSLGVLLYELLTGSTPFDTGELLKSGLDEIRRVIREQEPPRPSTRLSQMTRENLTTVALRRKAEPPKLIRTVFGDLDWIAIKALEKDRTRRYETASALAMDLTRFLGKEPISARPPGNLYMLGKMVARNKLLFLSIGTFTALLAGSAMVSSLFWLKERQARQVADAAEKRAEMDKAKAQVEAVKSRQVTQFLGDMLQSVGPSIALGRDTTLLREVLDRTAERVGKEMINQPAVEAELRSVIGRLFHELGSYDRAEEMHRRALALNRDLFGEESEGTATALNDLGLALWKKGRLADAQSLHTQALAIRRKVLGNMHPDVAASLNRLADVCRRHGKLEEAEGLSREALEIRRKAFGSESLEVADSLRTLSILLGDRRRFQESETAAREVLGMRRKLLGPEQALVASALDDVAWTVSLSGQVKEAEALERQALNMRRKLLGEEHPDVARSLYLLGSRMRHLGKLNDSESVLRAALAVQRKLLGVDNPATLDTLRGVGLTLEAEGKLAEAEAVHREALVLWRKRGEQETPQGLSQLENLSRVLLAQKKYDETRQLLDEALTPSFIQLPVSAKLLVLRVDLNGRRRQWQAAAADAMCLLELRPNPEQYCIAAALVAKTRNQEDYDKVCRQTLTSPANESNPFAADQLAKACLLRPSPVVNLEQAARWADTAVRLGAGDQGALPFYQVCKALSEFRRRNFSEAIQWAEKSVRSGRAFAQAQACAILAMSHWELGQKETAQEFFAEGEIYAPPALPAQIAEEPDMSWLGWLYARISLDEAAELIQARGPG